MVFQHSLLKYLFLISIPPFEQLICSAVRCGNIPSGLDKLSRGVDITQLDIIPIGSLQSNGFKRSILNLTCHENKKWVSPFDSTLAYDLPDQVETINTVPGGVMNANFRLHRTQQDVKRTMALSAEVGLIGGMFSSSASYKRFQQTISNSTKFTAEVEAFFSATRSDFAPYFALDLTKYAKQFVDSHLPKNYTENPQKFKEFIQVYGTHYFSSGRFGGLIRLYFEMNQSLLKTMSTNEIKANAMGSFLEILKANGAYNGVLQTVSEAFLKQTQTSAIYYGGNANLLKPGGFQEWWNTVPSNPWLFGGQLEPITKLISDEQKKIALEYAIKIYLGKAYIEEAQRLLYSFIGKGRVGDDRARIMIAEAESLLAEANPDTKAINDFVEKVNNFIFPPEWFTDRTEMCFRWYPDGDGGQCRGPSRKLCAKTNEMTSWYRDDTDRRGGGCQMMWGIESPLSPGWFQNVKVCFRWYADGDGGQCGDGAPAESCASIGQYTAAYRDDTDNRGGGCQMSWRLIIPSDAPGWMLNIRLCYNWYPDGDGGQCGGGADRNLCALANNWTPYYRDDTDRRGGGCQMSWGLKTLDQP